MFLLQGWRKVTTISEWIRDNKSLSEESGSVYFKSAKLRIIENAIYDSYGESLVVYLQTCNGILVQ